MASTTKNQAAYEAYLKFRESMDKTRAATPLKSPNGYFPYFTLNLVPKIIDFCDKHSLDLVEMIRGKTVIDIGCGDGELSFFLETFGPSRQVAVDWAPVNFNGMEACYALKDALGSKVEFVNGDVHTLDLAAIGTFDTAFCLGFLYHSPNPMLALDKISHATRSLFLSSRIFDNPEPIAYFFDELECNNDSSNWWVYTPSALERMLKRSGLAMQAMERLDNNIGRSTPADLANTGAVITFSRSMAL